MVSTCFNEVGGSRGSRQQLLPGRGALGDDPMGWAQLFSLRWAATVSAPCQMEIDGRAIRLGPCEHSTIFVGDASEITIDTVWTWNLMESHGISWNLHLKGMGARELGSKVIAKTIDAESYSVYIYIYLFIYIFIPFIYLFILKKYYIITLYYKWFHMHLVIDSNYLLYLSAGFR